MTAASGPSAGVLGKAGGNSVPAGLYRDHPEWARELLTTGRHRRAGHDRARWETVGWEDYRAQVGICQRRGPWSVEMAEERPDSPSRWVAEAEGMPCAPGWYTALVHAGRGLVMSDLPAEIAGCLPFMDRAAAEPGRPWFLIGGLGLGIVPAWLLRNVPACRVDVVEIDLDVIGLITEDGAARDAWAADPRLHVHWADALTWQPGRNGCALHRSCMAPRDWDAAWWDLWDTVSPANLPSMRRLHRRYARRACWQMSWERAECEAMRARGQVLERPGAGEIAQVCHVSERGE